MFHKLLPFLALAAFWSSCNPDFKVGAPYKEVSVVYALLSASDTANYIKITKGFFDDRIDNLLIARNADSLYYKNLEVKLQELNNGNVVNTFTLTKVDANLEGFEKDSGTFVSSPNYAYKHKGTLNPTRQYKLLIKNSETGKEITGTTDIIPVGNSVFYLIVPFVNPFGPTTSRLMFNDAGRPQDVRWGGPDNAAVYDVRIRVWYEEKNTNTLKTDYKFKDLLLSSNISASANNFATISPEDFFRVLNSEVTAAPNFISRYIDTPELIITAGGSVLKTYIDINSAQSGITFDQIKPNFTNLTGEDVIGFLSTRGSIVRSIPFNDATIDSILYGSYTRNLNFVGRSTR